MNPGSLSLSRGELVEFVKRIRSELHFGLGTPADAFDEFANRSMDRLFGNRDQRVPLRLDLERFLMNLIFDHSLDNSPSFDWQTDLGTEWQDSPGPDEPLDTRNATWAMALEWIGELQIQPQR